MKDFTFNLNGSWQGSWDGKGRIHTNGLETAIAVDPSMNGSGQGTNPDELLLSALASCYMITLGIRLNKEGIDYDHVSIRSVGIVTKKDGLHFEKVTHYPVIYLNRQPSEDSLRDKLLAAVHRAEMDCMIAKAVHGNISISIEPAFEVCVPN
ncbi:MAG: OsmC family protein [Sporolactobacillus sp.]